jgi:hypothetical protein
VFVLKVLLEVLVIAQRVEAFWAFDLFGNGEIIVSSSEQIRSHAVTSSFSFERIPADALLSFPTRRSRIKQFKVNSP